MIIPYFQTLTSVHPHLAKMAAHVSISLGVTGVIALLDGLVQIARVNNLIYAFVMPIGVLKQ